MLLSNQGVEQAVPQDRHLMVGQLIGHLLQMGDRGGALCGNVLDEGSAQSHIHDLQTPADAQHGLVQLPQTADHP